MDARERRNLASGRLVMPMNRTLPLPLRLPLRLLILVAATLALAACGGDSDGDEDESATATEVVEEAAETEIAASPAADTAPGVPVGTPAAAASPVETDMSNDATPSVVAGTPPIVVPTSAGAEPTPATGPDASPAAQPPVGNATPAPTGAPDASESDGTGGEPPTGEGTPGDAGALTESLTGVLSSTATSCDYTDYPAYTGTQAEQVTTSEVNFRAGPGAECDPLSEVLAEGTTVTVLSQPVQREGDTENIWVAVSVDGVEGWIVAASLFQAE